MRMHKYKRQRATIQMGKRSRGIRALHRAGRRNNIPNRGVKTKLASQRKSFGFGFGCGLKRHDGRIPIVRTRVRPISFARYYTARSNCLATHSTLDDATVSLRTIHPTWLH